MRDEHGEGMVPLPSTATFYRLVARVAEGRHTFGQATTRRSLANRPDPPFGAVHPLRPGEWVQVDTTPLDVLVLLDDGTVGRAELTKLMDVATRSICAAALRPKGTKAVDAALLLGRMMVPEPMRPGWPQALAMSASRLPHRDLVEVDRRLDKAAARPVIVPETIVCDHGSVYLSETFQRACRQLGVSIQPTHQRSPFEKGAVERTFESINTLFCQYVAGYVGRDVSHRGAEVDGQVVWSIGDLQDLLDEWVLIWQNRPHDGLRDPHLPAVALSPNEMYAAMVAAAGYVPMPLSGEDYLELLPVQWRRVTVEGITLNHLTYDCPQLAGLRGQRSAVAARSGRWEVHYDPYDLAQVWVRNLDGGWITVPWVHAGRLQAPFADFTARHARRIIAARGGDDTDQNAIAAALESLLTRAENGPPPTSADQRAVARTRAAAATSLRPTDPPPPAERASTDDGDEGASAAVVPLGVFDAREEAQRYR